MNTVLSRIHIYFLLLNLHGVLVLLCLYTLCLCTSGCRKDPNAPDFSTVPPTDTKITNEVRKKIGIRQIKADWTFYGRRTWSVNGQKVSNESWMDGGRGGSCKSVHRDEDGNIEWESDCYYSGAMYPDPTIDGSMLDEFLQIHYSYGSQRIHITYIGDNPVIISMFEKLQPTQHGYMSQTNKETFSIADTILKKFGLSRL